MTARFVFSGTIEELRWQNWNTLPALFKSEETRWVYIGPDGSWWDLSGPKAGWQGVMFGEELQGHIHMPFEHLLTEAAYQIGASYERSNIVKRLINCEIIIGSESRRLNARQYEMVEKRWWNAWPIGVPGWLGVWSPTGGWRWAQVMQSKPSDTSQKRSPKMYGNNTAAWDMQLLCVKPWYAKRALIETFTAHPDTITNGPNDYDEETITIANRGDMPQWPKFLYSGPGRAWIQDGMTDRMVEMPLITADESPTLVDTDEGARTLTGASDPIDNVFYQLIRQSRILDFFLHDVGAAGLPVWRRANGIRFNSMIPARTVANLKVRHSEPGGTVTVIMPQWYTRPF